SVQVWVPDETETTKVPGNEDHTQTMSCAAGDLLRYARQQRLIWLVRFDTELDYPRADGSTGSLYPDLIVARDVQVPPTEPYDITVVGKPPDLIVEVLSPSTASEDRGRKLSAYAQMGVGEYLIFDPRPRDRPLLAGYRLVGWGDYEPIPPAWGGGVWLQSLNLRALAEPASNDPAFSRGPCVRFFTQDGEPLPHMEEEVAQAAHIRQEYAQVQQEYTQVQQEYTQVRQEYTQVQQEYTQVRQEYTQVRQAYESEREARVRAEQERAAAEAELARLRALLGDKG
ncbi:MAG TPA: Uma2 family endonuclease, partial [Chloroflexota bacterium]|nr:Uma2 family endonuclease [Chloroflexota bacterium]